MNVLKHMEAIFFAAAAIGVTAAVATSEPQPLLVAADRPLFIHPDVKMPVVTVSAKRLSPAEKAELM
ncbi:hypothetical protein [Massilia sp. METH4]|uniref:hypothetical protein n=1 Tax=Massilia sp. METH4 TaxID=3123041 RepID=UPI0030CE56C4